MTEEFCLTKKIMNYEDLGLQISLSDVKEFIKRDWALMDAYIRGELRIDELIEKREQLAGESLTK